MDELEAGKDEGLVRDEDLPFGTGFAEADRARGGGGDAERPVLPGTTGLISVRRY